MPKNYTLEYLSGLHTMLEDETNGVESMLTDVDNGEANILSHAKKTTLCQIAIIEQNIRQFKEDIRNLKYPQFTEKYLK